MSRILLIETSTALCSVALAVDGGIAASRESDQPRSHAAMTAPFIKELLDSCGLFASDLDAVCVSAGPGSYTGLRVGVSTAKGICFAAGVPLLSVGTLEVLVSQARAGGLIPEGCRYVIPLLDARRMEVYTAVFTPDGRQLTETRPQVIESLSQVIGTRQPSSPADPAAGTPIAVADLLAEGPVLFIGDGASKCREVLAHPNAYFSQCCPKASAMLRPAFAAWDARRFEDTAYFEPFYLKDFIATVPRKKLF